MLPGNICHLCQKLLASPSIGSQKQVLLREPLLEDRIDLFVSALKLLRQYVDHPLYGLYVCTVLGYRRLVVRDGACPQVDNIIVELLCLRPEIVPRDCYADRLPPQAASLMSRIRMLRRNALRPKTDAAYLERMAAD